MDTVKTQTIYTNGTDGHHSTDPTPWARPLSDEHLTDLGNAFRFVRQHGTDLRYTEATGWLVWTGTHWQRDETGHVTRLAKQTAMSLCSDAAAKLREVATLVEQSAGLDENDPKKNDLQGQLKSTKKIANALQQWALDSQGRSRINAMIELAKTELPIACTVDEFDKNPWLFNVKNGTIDLPTGKLYPHRRSDLLTICVDVTFDPDAVCPGFITFFNRIMQRNENLITFVQRAAGYSLTGVVKTEDLFFTYGPGGNGKSTFFNIIKAIMGGYLKKLPFSTLIAKPQRGGASNDLAMLRGARMVVASEIPHDVKLASELVKDLTGRDEVSVRFLFKEFFDLHPSFKLWIYGNHKPKIDDRSDGIWRRVHLTPFTAKISDEEKDPNLEKRLIENELSGILNWLIEGCLEWQRIGLAIPDEVKIATEDYKSEGDTISRFIDEHAILNANASIRAGKFADEYQKFCAENNLTPLRGNELWEELEKLGITRKRDNRGNTYHGIGLLDHTNESEN